MIRTIAYSVMFGVILAAGWLLLDSETDTILEAP